PAVVQARRMVEPSPDPAATGPATVGASYSVSDCRGVSLSVGSDGAAGVADVGGVIGGTAVGWDGTAASDPAIVNETEPRHVTPEDAESMVRETAVAPARGVDGVSTCMRTVPAAPAERVM